MLNGAVVECVISCIVIVYCYGKPLAEPQDVQKSELLASQATVQKLYSLLNESLLKETLSEFSKNDQLTSNPSNEVLFTSRPLGEAVETDGKSTTSYPVFEERFKEHSKFVIRSALENEEPKPTTPADSSQTASVIEDRLKETTPTPASASKSPLEYNPQKPSFAGNFSSGQLGQLVPPGKPWPADPPISTPVLEDRFQDTTLTPVQSTSADKSPLEYNPQKPSFAGTFSSGQLGQLIPPGKPWPADPPISTPLLEDRFQDNTPTSSQSTFDDKFPLDYNPQKPSFAGTFSSGQLGQLVPPGKPWPADPPISTPQLEDRFQDTTETPAQSTSPLEYNPQKPSFAGTFSSGQLGQLIPPGKPWPADPPISARIIKARFQETVPQFLVLWYNP